MLMVLSARGSGSKASRRHEVRDFDERGFFAPLALWSTRHRDAMKFATPFRAQEAEAFRIRWHRDAMQFATRGRVARFSTMWIQAGPSSGSRRGIATP